MTKRWIPFLLWLGFVAGIIASADLGKLPGCVRLIYTIPFGDKVGHFCLIGSLAFLLDYALDQRKIAIAGLAVPLAGLIIAGVMTVEETSQIWIPTRTFELGDLAANYSGIAFACWLGARFFKTKNAESEDPQ